MRSRTPRAPRSSPSASDSASPARRRVSTRIRDVLSEADLSLAELSDMTEIPYGALRRITRGVSPARLEYALKIAEALDVPLESLFALTRTMRRSTSRK